jgi:hypothetical protein
MPKAGHNTNELRNYAERFADPQNQVMVEMGLLLLLARKKLASFIPPEYINNLIYAKL